ncbi:MAG: hypothetical protein JWO58_2529 [Chitinophagaceae bacterium]|nr:hypothetical protein [Chitinophagaceae bacterium]
MKIILSAFFILTALTANSSLNGYKEYKEGFENGYKSGWCYNKGAGCYAPYPPYPPYPKYNEDNYQGGYNKGFLQGISEGNK